MPKETNLRAQINKLEKTIRILGLAIFIGALLIIIAAGLLVYNLIFQPQTYNNLIELIEDSPLIIILPATGGLLATLGLIPSFYLNLKKAKLLEELKNLTIAGPACTK